MPTVKLSCAESWRLKTSGQVCCYCFWESNQHRNICFETIKLALIKSYHLRMCHRVMLWFAKLPKWNHHVNGAIFESSLRFEDWPQWNCHVNETTFQSGLRFETGLISLRVSCKRALILSLIPILKLSFSNHILVIPLGTKLIPFKKLNSIFEVFS